MSTVRNDTVTTASLHARSLRACRSSTFLVDGIPAGRLGRRRDALD